jgi:hypothetical protein
MQKMNISGTPEQVMQYLADQIGKLTERVFILEHQTLAQGLVLRSIMQTTKVLDKEWHELLVSVLTDSRNAHQHNAETGGPTNDLNDADQERAKEAFRIIAESYEQVLDWTKSDEPVPLKVIKGGLDDNE